MVVGYEILVEGVGEDSVEVDVVGSCFDEFVEPLLDGAGVPEGFAGKDPVVQDE